MIYLKKHAALIFWIVILICFLIGLMQPVRIATGIEAESLLINEFLADNGTGLVDEDGDYSDWIEIYNASDETINLAGWSLTDDPTRPEKWIFPDMTLDSGAYLVVFASAKDRKPAIPGAAALHTNFKLNRQGEFLGLYNIFEDRFVDQVSPQIPQQFRDLTYGRYGPESAYGYLRAPTPGGPNDEQQVWVGLVANIEFSRQQGFYDEPFALELKSSTPEAIIRYTTDGSEPTAENGLTYTEPIPIRQTTVLQAIALKPNFLPSSAQTRTYIFLNDVLAQANVPSGFPETWGIHDVSSAKFGGYIEGTPVIADYEMDADITNNPRYQPMLKEGLRSIPTISIVTDMDNFTELYSNPSQRGVEWERPASITLMDPTSDKPGFQIKAGLRFHGHAGGRKDMPKHSFRLFFKADYGATKLEYPLFETSPVERFDTIVLRAGADRGFAGNVSSGLDPRLTVYTRDEWMRASQIEMSGVGSHGIFVHVYLNGVYWGLYNLIERPDASFMAAYLGGKKEEWHVRNHSGVVSGSTERIDSLEQVLAARGGLDNLSSAQRYDLLSEYLNIPHFIDYVILNWYAGTRDWPSNNWYAGVRNPSGQIYFFVWDAEFAWTNGAEIELGKPKDKNLVRFFFDTLIENPDFRMQFADRLYKHLFNDGALSQANAQARWLRLTDQIETAIVAESARWGDVRYEEPITYEDWLKARADVLNQMKGNAAKLIALTRQVGYYPLIDPPLFNQPGGLVEPGFELRLSRAAENVAAENGTIYYTLDGSDPRRWGSGEVAPGAIAYAGAPIVLTTTTQVKARLLAGDSALAGEAIWSALNETIFRVVEDDSKLRITEIMYNPPEGSDYEFIELKNVGDNEVDLADTSFEGINFTFFPNMKPLAPGEMLVLARNRAAFAAKYPDAPLGGVYGGQLSNKGETLALKDALGKVIVSVTYDDENGWPISPDGRGDSLVLAHPTGDPNDPKNWRASVYPSGTPGRDEPGL